MRERLARPDLSSLVRLRFMIDEGAVGDVRTAELGDDVDQPGHRDQPEQRHDRDDFCADFQMLQHGNVTRLTGRVARPVLLKSIVAERTASILRFKDRFGLTRASCDRLAGSDVVATNKRRYSLILR